MLLLIALHVVFYVCHDAMCTVVIHVLCARQGTCSCHMIQKNPDEDSNSIMSRQELLQNDHVQVLGISLPERFLRNYPSHW